MSALIARPYILMRLNYYQIVKEQENRGQTPIFESCFRLLHFACAKLGADPLIIFLFWWS